MREYVVGHAAGLQFSLQPRAFVIFPILWVIAALAAVKQLRVSLRAAASLALAAILGHLLSSLWHHLGHAFAARATGYPMAGISSWGLFATSVYPVDEPPLPAEVHIRRALGGPLASGVLTLLLWAGMRVARTERATTRWVLGALVLDNLLLNTLQVFIPMRINDGETLRRWLPELRKKT